MWWSGQQSESLFFDRQYRILALSFFLQSWSQRKILDVATYIFGPILPPCCVAEPT